MPPQPLARPKRQHPESPKSSAHISPNSTSSSATRRGMDLQSMLNPSDEDQRPSCSPSPSSASMGTNDDQNLQQIPISRRSTHFSRSPRSPRCRNLPSSVGSDSERCSSSYENDVPARSRSFRPPYLEEQSLFIWFHRVDLNWPWDEVRAAFRRTFNEEGRKKDGLQCKYYRVRAQYGVPRVRDSPGNSIQNGMWATTGRRYPWMEAYAPLLPGMHYP